MYGKEGVLKVIGVKIFDRLLSGELLAFSSYGKIESQTSSI